MKKNISYVLIATSFISILICCSKEHSPSSPGSPSSRVLQKWNIIRRIDTIYTLGGSQYLDYQPTTHSGYLDFRSDGKLYRLENGVMDTATFSLRNDSSIEVSSKFWPLVTTFRIELSTTDSLQLDGYSQPLSHEFHFTHYYLNKW